MCVPCLLMITSTKFFKSFLKIVLLECRYHHHINQEVDIVRDVDVVYYYRVVSCVCWSVMIISPAKTAKPIEMPFGLWTQVGPRKHILDGGPDSTRQF